MFISERAYTLQIYLHKAKRSNHQRFYALKVSSYNYGIFEHFIYKDKDAFALQNISRKAKC